MLNAPSAPVPRLCISNHGLRHSGGIERYALTLVRGLHALGVRPTVVAKAFDRGLPEYGWVDPVQVPVGLVPGKLRDLYFDWRLRRLKRRRDLGPWLACNQTGAADLAVCGSTHPGYLAALGLPVRRSDRWKIDLEHRHLHAAQVVVAHSGRMADEAMRHHGVTADKIRLMHPPVDAQRFAPVPPERRAALRAGLGLPDDRAVFLLASTGHRRKGLDLLIEVFARCPLPVQLVLVGRPLDRPAPHVRDLGYRSDIEDIFRAVDFTVLASAYEPFGLVGIESVLCGTPVVVADNVGCAEVIGADGGQRFSLAEPASLDRAVAAAVQRWRDNGHRLAEPHKALRYDPAVAAHVQGLLRLADALR